MTAEFTLVVRRYAPFDSFGGGFEGDNRQFSTSANVTARTVGMITFNPSGSGTPTTQGFSSGSSYVGPWAVRQNHRLGAIGKHIGQVRVLLTNVSSQSGRVSFTVQTSGNLPLKDIIFPKPISSAIDKINSSIRPGSPNPQGSPNIDTYVDFKASMASDFLAVEGVMRGDAFPNAEVFLLDSSNTANAVPLLDYQTSSGVAGPIRLMFSHPHTQRGSFSKRIALRADGTFSANPNDKPTVVREA